MQPTIILSHSQIAAHLDRAELFEAIKEGFKARTTTDPAYRGRRHPVPLPGPAGRAAGMVLSPGLIPSIPAYTVKVNSKFPDHAPAIKGIVVMHSVEDGRILAILDSGHLTAERTAAAGAVAADMLARDDADTVAIIGCGVQGLGQLSWMPRIRPIRRAVLCDTVPEAARAAAKQATEKLGLTADVCDCPKDAAGQADIVVTATWASDPILFGEDVRPGTHITTLGADGPNECEISADLIERSRFFADDANLQIEMGAIGGAGLGQDAIYAELGDVIAGDAEGRVSDKDITICGMVGLPFEDLAAAWFAFQGALAAKTGTAVDLLG